ncbi:RICIN domain-containing protein [Actinoplanes sp. NPDC023801]|uniref:RICIN domain-containing protein n=1 Tax=Actinoplanes sp. NPDC023801 TaxID=3154595 RepID=UPI0033EAF4D3
MSVTSVLRGFGVSIATLSAVGAALAVPTAASAAPGLTVIQPSARPAQAMFAQGAFAVVALQPATQNSGLKEWGVNPVFDPTRAAQGYVFINNSVAQGGRSMALDVSGDSTLPGAAILTRPFDGTASQEWRLSKESSGDVILINRNSGLRLTVTVGSANGVDFRQQAPGGEQRFRFIASS